MKYPDLTQYDLISFDTETTGLNLRGPDKMFGFSISTKTEDYYWDIRKTPRALEWLADQLKELKRRGKRVMTIHNLSFDFLSLDTVGVELDVNICMDAVILACLCNEHEYSYDLDSLARSYKVQAKKGKDLYQKMAEIFGGRATKNVQMPRLHMAPVEVVAEYAKGDTRTLYELTEKLLIEIKKQDLQKIVDFEQAVTPALIESEYLGVRVDIPKAEQAVATANEQVKALQKRLDREAGFKVGVNTPGDMRKLFAPAWKDGRWVANDGTPLAATPGGKASLNAASLEAITSPAAKMVVELRSLIRLRDTFLVGHILESAWNGRVYPNINQTKGDSGGTGTGRLSYVKPALQQIPDRNKDIAQAVKSAFLPELGHKWIDADKASFEVRIFGHLINNPSINQRFIDDPETDFHAFVADLTNLPRNPQKNGGANAKQLNLSMIFNQGDGATAEKMGLPWSWESFTPSDSDNEVVYKKPGPEAIKIINDYHTNVPGIKKLANGCQKTAIQRGYLFTRRGRHLRFPHKSVTYKSSGILIQATSADENKASWVLATEALKEVGGRILLNTHDSYSMTIPEGSEEKGSRLVKEAIEADRGLRVPLLLEVNRPGDNWWEAKSNERWM